MARAEGLLEPILADEPERDAQVMVCLRAWADLSTCRTIGMAAGPIPWTAIVGWCDWHQLDRDNAALVVAVIRQLDNDRAEAEQAKRDFDAMRGGAGQRGPVGRGGRR